MSSPSTPPRKPEWAPRLWQGADFFAWIKLLARNRFVIGSVAAMAISFFAFMKLLSMTDLSFAVPVSAVTYVMETVLAKYLLKERVNGLRWTGAALVICGVTLVSL